jgi:hypothetical protein
LTKRFIGIAVSAAAASAFLLPAAPANASCISMFTTPVDCIKEAVSVSITCVNYGTYRICPPPATS